LTLAAAASYATYAVEASAKQVALIVAKKNEPLPPTKTDHLVLLNLRVDMVPKTALSLAHTLKIILESFLWEKSTLRSSNIKPFNSSEIKSMPLTRSNQYCY